MSRVDEVRAAVAEHLEVDGERLTEQTSLSEDLGLDSLAGIELATALEDRFSHADHRRRAGRAADVRGSGAVGAAEGSRLRSAQPAGSAGGCSCCAARCSARRRTSAAAAIAWPRRVAKRRSAP